MKKRLLLLPLIAGFALSGCSFEDLMFWKKKGEDTPKKDELPPEDDTDHSPTIKEEFGDYEVAKELKDGGKYILGVYRHDGDFMRFFSGDYHRDKNGQYPYYLGTLDNFDSYEGAAEIEVHYINDNEFTMQVHAEGLPWDGKYMGVYSAHDNSGDPVMSIAVLDSPDQTDYYPPQKDGSEGTVKADTPSGTWKFHTVEDELNIYAPAADYRHEEGGDAAPVAKYLGTTGDYVSMDCRPKSFALDGVEYDLARLYQLKEAA